MKLRDRLEAADDRRILREWPQMMQRGPRWFAAQRAASNAFRLAVIAPIVRVLEDGMTAISMRTFNFALVSFVVIFVAFYVLSGLPAAVEWRRRGERYAELTGDQSALRHAGAAGPMVLEPVLGGIAVAATLLALWAAQTAINTGSMVPAALAAVALLIATGFAGRLVHLVRQSPFRRRDVSRAVGA